MSFERVIACILQFEHKYANLTLKHIRLLSLGAKIDILIN